MVVKPLDIKESDKAFKNSIIEIPDIVKNQEQRKQIDALFICSGDDAFDGWKGRTPKPGDKVVIDRYAGFHKSVEVDGEQVEYRLMNDDQIIAINEEE